MKKVPNSLLKDATTTGKGLIAATSAAAARTTLGLATVASSGDYNDLSNKPSGGGSGVTFAKTKVVGVDAATIQGCIDLVTGATGLNQTQILIPPGIYNENLTLKPCVSLASTGGNNGQGSVVRINGYHSCQGSANVGDSILELNGLRLDTTTTNPALTLTANGSTPFLVHMQDCMVGNSNSSTAVVGVQVNANVSVRAANVRSVANSTAGSGGTHWDVNGGSLYLERCSGEFGTGAILMRGTNGALTPYVECKWSSYITNGANAISITSATALLTMGWSAFQNLATTGNGISIAAGSVAGVFNSTFTVVAGASNYVVTGDVGSVLYQQNNNYSNAPYATYETKINSSVTQFTYSPSRLNLGQTATPSAPIGGEAWLSSSNILTWYGQNSTQYTAAALSVANQFTAQQQLNSGLKLTSSSGPTITAGTNTPEGAVTAPVGSLFLRTNGAANTTLYVKQTGSGNTGWTATAPAAITQLTGDVTTSTGGGSQAATLATLAGLTTGQYGSASSVAQVTVNAKGLTTLATSVPISITTAQVTGLGGSAVLNVGTTAGTVAAGNDSRFTDSRTPTGSAGGDLTGTYPNPTLAAVAGLTSGQYGNASSVAQVTVNAKGLLTLATSVPIAISTNQVTGLSATALGAITQLSGDVTTGTGGGSQAATLKTLSGLASGQYGNASSVAQVTVNEKGLTTLASSVPIAITASQVSGTVAVANGGTGQTSYTNGQLLIGNSSGGLTKATLTAGSNVTITNGDGAITIASTGGGGGGSTTQVDVYTTSQTITIPAGAKSLYAWACTGGHGGGSGGFGVAQYAGGGGGGAGGNASYATVRVADLTALGATQLNVVVGAGGAGGAAVSSGAGAAGLAGQNSGVTLIGQSIGSDIAIVAAVAPTSSGAGSGGGVGASQPSAATGGTAALTQYNLLLGTNGGAGAGTSTAGSGTTQNSTTWGATGAGGGTSWNYATGAGTASQGGSSGRIATQGVNKFALGATSALAADNGITQPYNMQCGGGAGGGWSGNADSINNNGGNGGFPGGGGGGGAGMGSSPASGTSTATRSGKGGNGANGVVVLTWYF